MKLSNLRSVSELGSVSLLFLFLIPVSSFADTLSDFSIRSNCLLHSRLKTTRGSEAITLVCDQAPAQGCEEELRVDLNSYCKCTASFPQEMFGIHSDQMTVPNEGAPFRCAWTPNAKAPRSLLDRLDRLANKTLRNAENNYEQRTIYENEREYSPNDSRTYEIKNKMPQSGLPPQIGPKRVSSVISITFHVGSH